MKITFVGLGSMGAPIARRLARSGYEVKGCDVFPAALEAFDEPGTTREADPIEATRGADILGICVRTDAQLEDLCKDDAIFAALGEGKIVILNSTVAPELAQKLADRARRLGIGFIDVGVSGGAPKALEGKLSLFVGGDEADVERVRPSLEAIGTVAYLGPVGRGLEGKLLNNLLFVAHCGMVTSLLDLGVRLNFDREQLRQALMIGSAQSFALQAVPGLIGWREGANAKYISDIHDLLAKDVTHAAHLVPQEDGAMAALQAASHTMLDYLKRAATERE